MARVTYVTAGTGRPESTAALEEVERTRGYVSNFHRTLAHLPAVLEAFERFSAAVRRTTLDDRLRELVICRVSALVGNEYEWRRHAPAAIEAGVSARQIEDLHRWRASDAYDGLDRAILDFVDAHVVRGDVDDDAIERLRVHLDDTQLVALSVIVGWYQLVSAIILPLRLSDDDPKPPAEFERPARESVVAEVVQATGADR